MTPELLKRLIHSLSRIRFSEDGEPTKGLMVLVGDPPYPDVVDFEESEDNIVLKVKWFQSPTP